MEGSYLFINDVFGKKLLGENFAIKDGVVNYRHFEEFNWFYDPILQADPETFRPFSKNSVFAKDAKNIYFQSKIISRADYDTFRPLDKSEILAPSDSTAEYYAQYYAKDKQNVFYYDKLINTTTPVDTSSFSIIGARYYAKDKNHVYYVVEAADLSDYKLEILEGAESARFSINKNTQGTNIGSDGKKYYWEYYRLPDTIASDEVKVVNQFTKTLRDNRHIYCLPDNSNKLEELKDVNPDNFKQDNGLLPKGIASSATPREYIVFTDGHKYYNGKCQQIEVQAR